MARLRRQAAVSDPSGRVGNPITTRCGTEPAGGVGDVVCRRRCPAVGDHLQRRDHAGVVVRYRQAEAFAAGIDTEISHGDHCRAEGAGVRVQDGFPKSEF